MSELIQASNTIPVAQRSRVAFEPRMQVLVVGDVIGGDLTKVMGSYAGTIRGNRKQVVETQNDVGAIPRAIKPNERILLPEENLTVQVNTRNSRRTVSLRKGSAFVEDTKITHLFHDPVTQKSFVVCWRANTASELSYSIDQEGVIRKFDRDPIN